MSYIPGPQKLGIMGRIRRALGLATLGGTSTYVGQAKGAKLIGTDLSNNKYWELPNAHGDTRPSATRRFVEYAAQGSYQDHASVQEKKMPVQWVLWLRHTRMDPPSLDELRKDIERIRITRHNARVLELKYLMEKQALIQEREAAHKAAIEAEVAKSSPPAIQSTESSAPKGRRRVIAAVPTSEVTSEGVPDTGVPTTSTSIKKDLPKDSTTKPTTSNSTQATVQPKPQPQVGLTDAVLSKLPPEVAEAVKKRAERRRLALETEMQLEDPILKAQAELARAKAEVNKSVLQDFEIDWTDGTSPPRT